MYFKKKTLENSGTIFNRDERSILDAIKIQEKESLRIALQQQIEEKKQRKMEEELRLEASEQ